MTHYAHLSPYTYGTVPVGVDARNLGWLEPGMDFPQREVPDGFLDELGVLCRDEPRMRMRGRHRCALPHADGTGPYPVRIQVGGTEISLGSAEVRVMTTDGRWLVAPNLVHHYIEVHSYLPPEDFIEAVQAHRVAPPER